MAQSMASLLQCPICLEAFEDPRMLTSCLHSLCHKCLGDHITHTGRNGQFQCPVCRKSQQIPDDGANAFPKNVFMNSCLEAVTDKETGARSKTGQGYAARGGRHGTREHECSNAEDLQCTQPEQFCLDCSEYYCKMCSKVHQKSKATRSHVQVPLDDLTDEMLRDVMAKSEAPRCPKHRDRTLELYCSTCLCAVCSVCSQIYHTSHTFQEISEVDEKLKSELRQVIASLQGLIDGSEQQAVDIKQSQQKVENATTTARGTIQNLFQKTQLMLAQKAKQIDQNICEISQDSNAKTNVQTKNLTLHTDLLQSLHTFTDDLLKRGSVYNRLASLPDVRNRIQEFQGSPLASADGATVTEIPKSADLVAKHLDGLVMTQEVKLGGPGSAAGPILEIKCTCSIKGQASAQKTVLKTGGATAPMSEKPKLRVVVYYRSRYSYNRSLVDAAVQSLNTRLTCDVSDTDKTPLQPEVTDRPQVDVIDCVAGDIDSVMNRYNISETTAGQRHLVLLHLVGGGSLTDTRRRLGQHVRHFQSIIWWNRPSRRVAIDSLVDYLLQFGGTT